MLLQSMRSSLVSISVLIADKLYYFALHVSDLLITCNL